MAQYASLLRPTHLDLLRLFKAQHELVDRAGRTVDVEVAPVLGVTQEVALGGELEAGGLDLAPQHALLDAMQGLDDRDALAGLGMVIGDDERSAGLERRKQLAVHL